VGDLLSVIEVAHYPAVKYYIAHLKNKIDLKVSDCNELDDAVYMKICDVFLIPEHHLREKRLIAFKSSVHLYEQWKTSISNNTNVNVSSKYISWVLRHGIIKEGLNSVITKDGYVPVESLLSLEKMKSCTLNHILHMVETSDKKRYGVTVRNDKLMIRANQGHCISVGLLLDDDLMMKRVTTAYPVCIHGTNKNAIIAIKESGLKPMDRKHVHMAIGLLTDAHVISGMRKSSNVIIHINMEKALKCGKRFYVSENNVILTPDTIESDLFDTIEYI
jgi:2'-phosphotransferase